MLDGSRSRHKVRQTPITVRCERIAQRDDLPDNLYTRIIRLKARGLTTSEVATIVGEKTTTVGGKLLEAIDWVACGCQEMGPRNRWAVPIESSSDELPAVETAEMATLWSEAEAEAEAESEAESIPAREDVSEAPAPSRARRAPTPRRATRLPAPTVRPVASTQRAVEQHRRWKERFYALLNQGYSLKEAAARLG